MTFGVLILAVIGFVIALQPVSLMTGSGMVWIGTALVGGATAIAFFMRARTWVRILTVILLALVVFNAINTEMEMSHRRDQLTHMFNH